MKEYEYVTRNYLTRRTPVIIRIDGKAFHTFTRGLSKPFDDILVKTMQDTMISLCESIQGCVLGYTQSDEITLILIDYKKINSAAWFDNNIQKMVSISSSLATLAFNHFFDQNIRGAKNQELYNSKKWKATFDSRVFNIPKEEVANCLIWRQQDATKNSIASVGQSNFSPKKLMNKNGNDIQEMLWNEKHINWSKDYPTLLKRGSCCYRTIYKINEGTDQEAIRSKWIIDNDIPIFTCDRQYIEKWI